MIFLSILSTFGVKVSFTNDCCRPFHHPSQEIYMPFQPWGWLPLWYFPYHTPFPKLEWIYDNIWIQNWMKDGMGWCCALLGYHPKVTSRSSQCHCKVKLKKHCFLSIPSLFGVQVIITNDCCWHIFGRVPFHHASQVCILTLGGDYRLGIPLITPISQSWSESTQVLKCSSVVAIDLESLK